MDDYQIRHFHRNLVYFGKTLPTNENSFMDEFVIFDIFEKKLIKKMEIAFVRGCNDLSIDCLYYFDRDSNIFIYDNLDTLLCFDKFGKHMYTQKSSWVSETFNKLGSLQKWSINNNHSLISAFNINSIKN